jgi:site-specific recombinase XerD
MRTDTLPSNPGTFFEPLEKHLHAIFRQRQTGLREKEMLFKRLKERAGIRGKRISPHILRHTFAMNYLIKNNVPFSLQELLGHEDLATVLNCIHMNDTVLIEMYEILIGKMVGIFLYEC